jgi:hypothetical protein
LLEAGIGRVTYEKEHIDKTYEADFPRPPLLVYQDFPWMDIAIVKSSAPFVFHQTIVTIPGYILIAFQRLVLDRSVEYL